MTFRAAVDTVAARNGLYADFGPKPLADKAGNGMHINFSAVSEDKRDVMPQVLAGVLAHVEAMTAFLNPTEESYRRFGSWKAPAIFPGPLRTALSSSGSRRRWGNTGGRNCGLRTRCATRIWPLFC